MWSLIVIASAAKQSQQPMKYPVQHNLSLNAVALVKNAIEIASLPSQ
jgi:hypothetical protein